MTSKIKKQPLIEARLKSAALMALTNNDQAQKVFV